MGPATVNPGQTADQVCNALKAVLDNDCQSPVKDFYGPPPNHCMPPSLCPCTFACFTLDANCSVLLDEKNCLTCDIQPNSTATCCGVTIDQFTP
jgi:hypothetical protein